MLASSVGDAPTLLDLLAQILLDEPVACLSTDGASTQKLPCGDS